MITQRPVRVTMLLRNAYTHDTRVEKEARSLRLAGYEVTIVAEMGPGLPRRETRDGISVVRVRRRARRLRFLRYLVQRHDLMRAVVRTRPDIMHAHDTDTLEPVASVARRLAIPFVYDAHDLWLGRIFRGRSALYVRVFTAFFGWIERTRLPRAAAWITVSDPIARHLERRYSIGPVQVVANVPERPQGTLDVRDVRSLPGAEALPSDAPIVLYVGGVMSGRGIEGLVEALGEVPGVHLVFLGGGGGPHAPEIMALGDRLGVASRMHMLPPVPPDDVIAYSASATVGVSAAIPTCLNYAYSMPNKLFQPMAAGVPVLASDFPQVRAVVVDEGAGVVVDMTRPAEIAAAIRDMLADRERLAAMGRNGRRAVDERYNWDVAGGLLVDIYRGIRPPA